MLEVTEAADELGGVVGTTADVAGCERCGTRAAAHERMRVGFVICRASAGPLDWYGTSAGDGAERSTATRRPGPSPRRPVDRQAVIPAGPVPRRAAR